MYNIEYLSKLLEKLVKEVEECYRNKCYIASMILYGAILETLLLCMCFAYSEQVRKTKVYQKVKRKCIKNNIRKRGFILEFTLTDLLKVSEELKWLPMKEKIENIGVFKEFRDWVMWVKETRNLVHPACWLKPDKYFGNIHKLMKTSRRKTIKKFVEISEETVGGIRELLLGKIMKDLKRKLKNKKIVIYSPFNNQN